MARARIKIPLPTQRLVLARSGGYCAVPSCMDDLFPEYAEGRIATVAKLAHIIGYSARGPRGDATVSIEVRNDASNIILLCSRCHDIVDDVSASDVFTPEVLREWKRQHEERVRRGAGIPRLDSREALDEGVAP